MHTEAAKKFPDRLAKLNATAKQVFADPEYETLYEKTGAPFEAIQYGDQQVCTKYALAMVDLANRFKPLLSAKK